MAMLEAVAALCCQVNILLNIIASVLLSDHCSSLITQFSYSMFGASIMLERSTFSHDVFLHVVCNCQPGCNCSAFALLCLSHFADFRFLLKLTHTAHSTSYDSVV